MEDVEKERACMQGITQKFSKRDTFNLDETSFFAYTPPDCGLASAQMSGKKKEKFRITVTLACNATGDEKLDLFFIGKSKQPRCFKKRKPKDLGFYYRNNKKAWMTSDLFEE